MISRRALGWVIVFWTLLSWGGRVGLLTDADASDLWSWTRIGGSLVVGLAAGSAFILGRQVRPFGLFFAAWTAVIWVRSFVTVWTEPNALAFRIVHTGLAAVWFILAVAAVRRAQATGSATVGNGRRGPGGRISPSLDTTSSMDR